MKGCPCGPDLLHLSTVEGSSNIAKPSHLISCTAVDPKALQEKLLKSAVEGGIRMLLQLLDHLVNAEQLLASPQASSLLVTPIPGAKASKPRTAEDLVGSIQVSLWPNNLSEGRDIATMAC